MNLEEFKAAFAEIRSRGFIKTKRRGPTGVGHTFEALLGLKENNLALPDIENIEIKAHRDESSSMITLFTFNDKAWKMKQQDAIETYGSQDRNGRLGMYYTVSTTPNSAGLFLTVDDKNNSVSVQHTDGTTIVQWSLDRVSMKFKEKLPALIFVSAHHEERDGVEYFYYYRAQLMSDTSSNLLADLFKAGNLLIDLRLHNRKPKSPRNHGTGFRVKEEKLSLVFKTIVDL